MPITPPVLNDEVLIFLDIETTGLKFDSDKIIEIGALKIKNGKVIERFHSLINPRVPIAFFITRLTGLKEEDLISKPTIQQKAKELFVFLNRHPIICHNASFEKGFLSAIKGSALENTFFDTCEIAALLYPTLPSHRLESLLKFFKIKDTEAHRALIDAEDTFKVWKSLFINLTSVDLERIRMMNKIFSKTNLPIKKIFSDLVRFLEKYSNGKSKEQEISSLSSKINTEGENRICPPQGRQQINKEIIKEIFKTGGSLSQTMKDYEMREEQMLMSGCVAEAFNQDKYLTIEAGAGVGKSLGYLIPCVIFSVNNKEKIVISTNTKNLQDQLTQKDIPLLKRILKMNFKTALIKGRENYLCLRKLEELLADCRHFDDEGKFALVYLISFKCMSMEGQLSDISPYLLRKNKYLANFVKFLVSELPFCLREKCSYFKQCFYHRMVRRAQEANILVANHALIFSQPHWMPKYSYLVLDEAHNIEDAATRAFTEDVSFEDLLSLMDSLLDKKTKKGLFYKLAKKKYSIETAGLKKLEGQIFKVRMSLSDFSKKIISFFAVDKQQPAFKIVTKNFAKVEKKPAFVVAKEACSQLINSLRQVIESLFLLSSASGLDFDDRVKVAGLAEKIESKVRVLKELLSTDNQEKIKWMRFRRVAGKETSFLWKFFSCPLEVGELLIDLIFRNLKAAVLTSATLTVGGNFSFFSQRVGLNLLKKERLFFKSLDSPFDFQKHTILGIPRDFPLYNYKNRQEFINSLARGIKKVALSVRGKSLVLFSSRERMEKVYMKIKEFLEGEGILTLCQGLDGSRYFLIRQLKEARGDILVFGSKSFQEGVDVSGLSVVFIDKLPFPHRHDPIISARRAHLIKKGKNPFKEYELPLASIALRQSFGRLIRKKSDFGLVIIFDNRLLDKDYKEFIITSLPQSQIIALGESEFYSSLKKRFAALKKNNQKS